MYDCKRRAHTAIQTELFLPVLESVLSPTRGLQAKTHQLQDPVDRLLDIWYPIMTIIGRLEAVVLRPLSEWLRSQYAVT
jgi:hypothetical protein